MLRRKLFIVLMVAVGSIGLTGCGGEAARSTQTQASSAGAGPNKNIRTRGVSFYLPQS